MVDKMSKVEPQGAGEGPALGAGLLGAGLAFSTQQEQVPPRVPALELPDGRIVDEGTPPAAWGDPAKVGRAPALKGGRGDT
jgi:hypothetical protein